MGNYSLLVTMGALAVVGGFALSSRDASQSADVLLADNTYKNVAREASVAGLNMTLRRLVADTTSWVTMPSKYAFTDQPYQNATFSTTVSGGYGSTVVIGRCVVDTVDVVSTAEADGGRLHELRATVVRTCSSMAGIPPRYQYAVISEGNLTLNGNNKLFSADGVENSDIHTNSRMVVNGSNDVEGFGSYVTGGVVNPPFGGQFNPIDDWNGSDPNHYEGSNIEIPVFVPQDHLHKATYVNNGNVRINGSTTIDFTDYQGITGHGTQENPFIWYIDGSLTISGDFRARGVVAIITTGRIVLNGRGNIYAAMPGGSDPPPSAHNHPNKDAVHQWIADNVVDGIPLGLYTSDRVVMNGNHTLVGQVTANSGLVSNGRNTIFGGIVSRSAMTWNGNILVWAQGPNQGTLLNGPMVSALPDGIRMIAYSEW